MKTYKATGLRPEILSALEDAGLGSPTPIQAKSIPFLLKTTRDLLGLAPQGAGKTGAYGLPILQRIDPSLSEVQALIICSRREASLKITGELRKFAKHLPKTRIFAAHDSVDIQIQAEELHKRVHVIVATPTRCLDLIGRGSIDLSQLRWLVIDDADALLEEGFQPQLSQIIGHLPRGHRTLAFASSTSQRLNDFVRKFLPEHEQIDLLSKRNDSPEEPVELEEEKTSAPKPPRNAKKPEKPRPDPERNARQSGPKGKSGIDHGFCLVPPRQRYFYLIELLRQPGEMQAIVFCRTQKRVHELTSKLKEDGIEALGINEETPAEEAASIMGRLAKGEIKILVSNSQPENAPILPGLSHIIYFNPPTGGAMLEKRMSLFKGSTQAKSCVLLLLENETPRLAELEERIGEKIEELRLNVTVPTSRKAIKRPERGKKKRNEDGDKDAEDKSRNEKKQSDKGRGRDDDRSRKESNRRKDDRTHDKGDEDRSRNRSGRDDDNRSRNRSGRGDDDRSRNRSGRGDDDRSRNRSGRGDDDRSRNQQNRRENETPRSQALPRRMERVHESEIVEGPPVPRKPKRLSSQDLAAVIEAVRKIDPTSAGLEREWSAIYKKLEKLTWEEVIRHFVAYIVQSDAVQDMEEKEAEQEKTGLRALFRLWGKKGN